MNWSVNKGLGLALMIISVVYLFLAFSLPEYAFVPVDSDLIPKILLNNTKLTINTHTQKYKLSSKF